MTPPPNGIYRDDLRTLVLSLDYDFVTRTGTLVMVSGCCADMYATITLFTAIDRDVERINTSAERIDDSTYIKVDGRWHARSRPKGGRS